MVLYCGEAKLYHLSDGDIDVRPVVHESHAMFSEKWEQDLCLWDYTGNRE